MLRRPTYTLLALGLFALSCEITPQQALPPVSAPGATASLALAREPGERFEAHSHDPMVERIARRFASQRRMGLAPDEIDAVAHAVVNAAKHHGVDPSLVLAVIHVESRYDTWAVSRVGAMGLMQILPATGRELAMNHGVAWSGPRTLLDPVANVWLGVAYLKQLEDRYGSTATALAAYNWGPGRIDRRIRAGAPLPTIYPKLVFQAYESKRHQRS